MKKIQLILLFLLVMGSSALAQSPQMAEDTVAFKPHGKVFAQVFSNFTYTLTNYKWQPAFEISRAYLGYEYAFSQKFFGKINFDVDNPGVGSLQMTAYLKNAYLRYADKNFRVAFGLIPTYQFRLQEAFWGHRYVLKSFLEQYVFGSSADFGVSLQWQALPKVNLDFSVLNGEGYRHLQADSTLMYTAGVTYHPINWLYARFYFDYMKKIEAQMTYAAFVGYRGKNFTAGFEYNNQQEHGNVPDHDLSGISLYGTLKMKNNSDVFFRYDKLMSKHIGGVLDGWHVIEDGRLYTAGMEYQPVKGVRISPNMSGWYPVHDTHHIVTRFNLNVEFKF
ncbi:hypothetical protein [Prolixibacter denitrificans]|uniref:OmpL-like beta-barrel porin-2 n=1 Tax=Prolixibacter denitrificans TaxID=1541063 RepID=A0A2P8C8C1_9BACT|nr:hypothetical protein [Prolixibacter denitrificans]PSK81220.1 hypothetical protein CLV93_1104 [Prolixibacter denitrificans]GET21695.1 hypothetical protein JCM18694_19410 [Prolixibacter denitrificans]